MLTIINQSGYPVIDQILHNLKIEGEKILNYLSFEKGRDWNEVNVLFVGEKKMLNLYDQFLKKKHLTDILTFDDSNDEYIQGDIALCLTMVLKNSVLYNLTCTYLFYETLLHGFLHLYGLVHGYDELSLKNIYKNQKKILQTIQPDESFLHVLQKIKY